MNSYIRMTDKHRMELYRSALEGAGPKLKELILDRASRDKGIDVLDLKDLVQAAYPEEG